MTPAERLRKHQRALEKTQRELDRERTKLEQQEKKLVADIKKNAKNGQMGAVKVQAKDLVRTRRYITKFYQMRTQLQAISLRIQVCWVTFVSRVVVYVLMGRSDSTKQRANDAEHERRDTAAGQHEPTDESSCATTNSDGV